VYKGLYGRLGASGGVLGKGLLPDNHCCADKIGVEGWWVVNYRLGSIRG